jgi:deoxycytidylate deaminase
MNPLFQDKLYRQCISNAVLSPCPKAGFGALIVYDGIIASESYNHNTIPEIASQCNLTCIRLNIQSRTESMLGSCSHAEEVAIDDARKKGIPLDKSDIYIAGIKADGLPWIKEDANHSCIRCAQQMYRAGIKNIYIPVKDKWEKISTSDAVKTAQAFALKDRKV